MSPTQIFWWGTLSLSYIVFLFLWHKRANEQIDKAWAAHVKTAKDLEKLKAEIRAEGNFPGLRRFLPSEEEDDR